MYLEDKKIQVAVRLPVGFVREFKMKCLQDETTVQRVLEDAAYDYVRGRGAREQLLLQDLKNAVREAVEEATSKVLDQPFYGSEFIATGIKEPE